MNAWKNWDSRNSDEQIWTNQQTEIFSKIFKRSALRKRSWIRLRSQNCLCSLWFVGAWYLGSTPCSSGYKFLPSQLMAMSRYVFKNAGRRRKWSQESKNYTPILDNRNIYLKNFDFFISFSWSDSCNFTLEILYPWNVDLLCILIYFLRIVYTCFVIFL